MSADFDSSAPPGGRPPGDELDPDLLAAAEAVADGLWSPTDTLGSLDPACLQQLNLIARVARVHATVSLDAFQSAAGGPDAPGGPGVAGAAANNGRDGGDAPPAARSSDSIADAMSRVPPSTGRPDLSKARRWGPLFVLERVGGGAFGEVFRAWDPALDREVALKLLRFRENSREADAVVREGHLLASINHPNVIRVFGAANVDGEVGIWMEFLRGRTLEQIIQHDGTMSADEATVVARELCAALGAVHQCGLLHRDIKASNVMRAAGGRYVLIDFGAGIAADAAGHRVAGTPLYMAPEVFDAGRASARSDVYSLGVLLFFLVTRTYPVYGKTLDTVKAAHASGQRLLLADVRGDLPPAFARAIDDMTSPSQSDRPSSVGMAAQRFLASEPAGRSWSRIESFVKWGVSAVGAFTFLGIICTAAQNMLLGREWEYAGESILWLPVWGIRALVMPSLFVLATLQAVRLLLNLGGRTLWRHVLSRSSRLSTLVRTVRGMHSVQAADAIVLFFVVLLVALCWQFGEVLGAMRGILASDDRSAFFAFAPERDWLRNAFSYCFATATFTSTAELPIWSRMILEISSARISIALVPCRPRPSVVRAQGCRLPPLGPF